MNKTNFRPYFLWILLSETVGFLSGWITRQGVDAFQQNVIQPPLSPPPILFPIVWTILYALMGIGAARVYLSPQSASRSRGLNLFVSQLIVNFFWSPIFFNAQAYGLAFFWILLLIVLVTAMIFSFRKTDPLAAVLQVPYLLWLLFAAYLNYGVWTLNR